MEVEVGIQPTMNLLKQQLFIKPKTQKNNKYDKVINNFLIKSKNFDYLESCYKMKPTIDCDKSKSQKILNVFKFTEPRIINSQRMDKSDSSNYNKIKLPKSQNRSQSLDSNPKEVKQENSNDNQQIQVKNQMQHVSPINSPSNISSPAFLLSKIQRSSFKSNDIFDGDTTTTAKKNKSLCNTTLYSRDLYRSHDNSMRRKSSFETYNMESDQGIQKQYSNEANSKEDCDQINEKQNLYESQMIQSLPQIIQTTYEQKLKQSINKIYSSSEIKKYSYDKDKQIQNNVMKKNQYKQLNLSNEQKQLNNELPNNKIKYSISFHNKENELSSKKDKNENSNEQHNNNLIIPKKVKNLSVHLDNRGKQKQLDQKHVLESKLFLEMHNSNKFSSHLDNLKRQPNQTKLLEDELNQYLPKELLLEQQSSNKSGLQNTVTTSFQNYYSQVCNCLNEFQNSLQEKNHIFDFKSYYSHYQDALKQQEKISVAHQMHNTFRIQTNITDPSTPISHLTTLNHYKNLNQVQQFKAQQIYSLLMNIQENYNYLLQIKKGRKKTLKALNRILGYNEQIKNCVLDEEQLNLKKNIDFSEGFSLETWKLIHSKNIKNIETIKKIPVETHDGIQYVPIDEGWNIYQIFQYFNQNLYNYIQSKLQVSEIQRKKDLNGYLKDIQSMKINLRAKPLINFKQLNEIKEFDKNVENILDRGQYVKREQVIKRLEKYEVAKGNFPFIGQLVRLKGKQIDKVQDVFRNNYKS